MNILRFFHDKRHMTRIPGKREDKNLKEKISEDMNI